MPTNSELSKQLIEILWQRTNEFASTTPGGKLSGEVMVSTYVSLLTSVIVSCPDRAARAEVLHRSIDAIITNVRAWQPPATPDEKLAEMKPEGRA